MNKVKHGVDPEPIIQEYIKLSNDNIIAVGKEFLNDKNIMTIMSRNNLYNSQDTIEEIFSTYTPNTGRREMLLRDSLKKIMTTLGIKETGNIQEYKNFWNALSSAIDTIKSSLNSSSSSSISAAAPPPPPPPPPPSKSAPPPPSSAAPSSVAPSKSAPPLPPQSFSNEDLAELGGGRRRRSNRKTKRTRKTRKTHRKNKKRSA